MPAYSGTVRELQAALAAPDTGAAQIAAILERDIALSAHVLRMANSSFFAGLARVGTVDAAIQRLGMQRLVEVALVCAQRGQYGSSDALIGGYMDHLWRHALGCAFGARWLAEHCGLRELAGEAFIAALLHDIGELLLIKILERIRAEHGEQPLPALLIEVLDAMHAEQGARLIEAWNLPATYAHVARTHHQPLSDSTGTLCLLVRMADLAAVKAGLSLRSGGASISLAGSAEAAALNLGEVTLAELEIFLEDTLAGMG
jgi:HD-like signal output (HDOD) protein